MTDRTFTRHTVNTLTVSEELFPPDRVHVTELPWEDSETTDEWFEVVDSHGVTITIRQDANGQWTGRADVAEMG